MYTFHQVCQKIGTFNVLKHMQNVYEYFSFGGATFIIIIIIQMFLCTGEGACVYGDGAWYRAIHIPGCGST